MTDKPNPTQSDRDLLEKFSAAGANRASVSSGVPEARCVNHRDVEGLYYCPNCRTWRCKTCARTFDGVAVCVECDSLAIRAAEVQRLTQEVIEKARPYSSHLLRALTYPFRHFVFTFAACAAVLLAGAVTQALSDANVIVPLTTIIAGPMAGWSGTAVAFGFAGAIAMTRLVVRANGQESWKWEQIGDFNVIGEPVAYWIAAAFIGLVPLVIDLWFYKFRTLMLAIVAGVSAESLVPKPTLGRWIGICFFSLWALFFYPMAWVVAGVRKSVLPILNPLAAIMAWIGLRRWLTPALAIVFAWTAATVGVAYFLGDRRGGLILFSVVMTLGNLISAQAIAAAVCEGVDQANLEGSFRFKLPEFFDRFLR